MEKNLGHATAYGYAKSKGYSGTEEEFAELMADYATVGQSAAQSAEQAAASATSASGSATTASQAAQTATSKASEAVTAADTATTKASEASTSASTASAAATSAITSAQTATTAATTATTKASEASESATTASTAKTDAESARDAAAQSASEAAASAESIDPETLEHKAYGAYVVESASGAIASFPDGADNIPMKDVLVHIEPVQAGSGDPSPDNVRPISGWTGAKVTRTGKNLLDMTNVLDNAWINVANTNIKSIDGANVFYADVPKNTTVIYSADKGNRCVIVGYKTRPSTIINSTFDVLFRNEVTQLLTNTFNTGDCEFVAFYLNRDQGNKPTWVQLELGSTATEYEPYSGQTYDITFPTEAGTVYGGTLDVTKGELVVDRAIIASYAGESLPSTWISDRDVYSEGATPTTGAQVCYKLATPITYTLTPQEITSLLGENNVWANTGNSDVEYRADTKMYVDNKIAELQALVLENNGGN